MKLVTIVGARPQFIKAAVVSRAISAGSENSGLPFIEEYLVHTGQHYDSNMSDVFFDELDIPKPAIHLGVKSSLHGEMTGQMLSLIEQTLLDTRPDWVLVYGDTNSTLAGALAAVKLDIAVAHVEAGLRSYNRRMPEELNRVVADHVSKLLFCPTDTAVENLRAEGITDGVKNVGDVMLDASEFYRRRARRESDIMQTLGLENSPFTLATCHRAENTDDAVRLRSILTALSTLAESRSVVLPLHPRTRKAISTAGLQGLCKGLNIIEPVSYLDMISLESNAAMIVTDSGGVQKEAYFFRVPCVTVRDETEWVETVESGWNRLAGADVDRILDAARDFVGPTSWPKFYGDGRAGEGIVKTLIGHL